jgi:hypothetical protein
MRLGSNIIEDDDPLFGESDPDHNRIFSAGFGHVIALATVFNEVGGTPFEAQAVSGDSGGAAYYNNGSNWELAAILNTAVGFPGQPDPRFNAIYGNGTLMVDLSIYRDQILEIRGPIVPEPSTWALAVVALIAGFTTLRRRLVRAPGRLSGPG